MTEIAPIRIVLADDHEIFRDGFKVMLKKQKDISLIGEASNGTELIRITGELKPDVIVTDIKMPRIDGIEATKIITAKYPGIHIIALTMFDDENLILEMLEAGASGYLLKSAHKNEIVEAIHAVYNNQTYYCKSTSGKLIKKIAASTFNPVKAAPKPDFSDKEIEVIKLICLEASSKEIAQQLCLSVRTIDGYRDKIQEKIKAKNVAGIVIYAIKEGIYEL